MSKKHDEYIKSIADKLIEQIKKNEAPWQKPWTGAEFVAPVNHQGIPYRGMNNLNLLIEAHSKGYTDNRWYTYANAQDAGGQVKRGEKGTPIVVFITTEKIDKTDKNGNIIKDENGKPIKEEVKLDRPKVMQYYVFNAEQVDGIPPREMPKKIEEWERHAKAEVIISSIQAQGLGIIHQAGDRAFYSPNKDQITMPERSQFASGDLYYATLLHEIGHATGHESRLNRDLSGGFGSVNYAKEELRAEIASVLIGQELQIGHDPSQHYAYLESWAKVLEDDPKEIFRAVKDADAIKSYVLDLGKDHAPLEAQAEIEETKEVAEVVATPSQNTNLATQDTPINVPYKEKNEAKALGAKWDSGHKTWYVPMGEDLNKFEKWHNETKDVSQAKSNDKRTYLYTSADDIQKLQALKSEGIVKFDVAHKVWYTQEADNPKVKQWLHPAHVPSAEEAFAEHLRANGISLDNGHPIADGRPHRLSNDGSNDKNVMYQLYRNDGGIPAGRITNFSRGGTPEKWVYPAEYIAVLKNIEAVNVAKGLAKPTPNIVHSSTEKTYPTQEQGQSPKTHSISPEQQATYDKTASRVAMVMQFAPLAQQHEYLDRKQVTHNNIMRIVPDKSHLPPQFANDIVIANGWKEAQALRNQGDERMILQKGNLMIPQFNAQGELRSFETIGYQGAKYALKVGEKNGLSVALGQVKNGEPVIITEGYATGATLHEQTNRAVLVAFGKGGLLAVAQQIREHCPDSKIYIGADNDHSKTENVGLLDAQKVAQTVTNTYVLAPQFDAGDKGKDWNDVYVDKGIDEFKRQLKEQLNHINPPKEQEQTKAITEPPKPTPREQLDVNFIKNNYPQMSDDNLRAIQAWREVIDNNEQYAPETKENLLERLANHIPDYANGEKLPLPSGYEQQQDMGKPKATNAEQQHEVDNGQER